MATILLINGPNLNLLGVRETSIYGAQTLLEITADLRAMLTAQGHELLDYQSNHEGAIVDRIQLAREQQVALIIMNPAAYTHTRVAMRDALLAVQIPFYEVHLSDPKTREPFRHHSYFSDIALEVFAGHGPDSYRLAGQAALQRLNH